jgi:hypothetical protein
LLNTILGSFSSGVAASTNSYESIATVTVGSGGTSTISFTSIPSTYTHLQLRGIARGTRANTRDDVLMRINSDSGNNYAGHQIYSDGSSVSASTLGGTPPVNYLYLFYAPAANATASVFGAGVIDILDYANTNKNKTLRSLNGIDVNGSGEMLFRSGLWLSVSAITSITLTCAAGNFVEYSQFALYGVKS